MPHVSYRNGSRTDWGVEQNTQSLTPEQITLGANLRMADSLERISRSLERIATVLECRTASSAARAIVRIDKRLAKTTPLGKGGVK